MSLILVLTNRSAASGDENEEILTLYAACEGEEEKGKDGRAKRRKISKRARSSRAHFDFPPLLRPATRATDPLSPTPPSILPPHCLEVKTMEQ